MFLLMSVILYTGGMSALGDVCSQSKGYLLRGVSALGGLCLLQGGVCLGGGIEGDQVQAHTTPKGEIEGNQVQAHTQGRN